MGYQLYFEAVPVTTASVAAVGSARGVLRACSIRIAGLIVFAPALPQGAVGGKVSRPKPYASHSCVTRTQPVPAVFKYSTRIHAVGIVVALKPLVTSPSRLHAVAVYPVGGVTHLGSLVVLAFA